MLLSAILNLAALAAAAALPLEALEARQSFSGSTENGFSNGGACNAVTVLFARGTTEAGNVGTLAGPPFFEALASRIGANKLTVQGVNYPADVQGFLAGGDAAGSRTLASLIGQVSWKIDDSRSNLIPATVAIEVPEYKTGCIWI